MGKLIYEVPAELKEFAGLFDQLSYRHSDYGTVFHDFVSYWTGGMLLNGDQKLAAELMSRYDDDYAMFNQLIVAILKAYNSRLQFDRWYDGLGLFYEIIASRYKSSRLGQFFTPAPVVDLMAELNGPIKGNSVMDCCSGSGRFLLAAKAANPNIWGYAADLDPVCAKMTALNMAMHGCIGEVSCMNSLSMEWRFGYTVNPLFQSPLTPPVPHLSPIENWEDSAFYVKQVELKKNVEHKIHEGQLSLF
ncbi:N-6 DNA methylase [Jiulongibacter sp. NS-SX5]|uniref:N-6 DNA methylase n=1 Tax=Jiulongibacter sp. NS-SX5 TaxID=3463854 RepID=UPI00405800F5